MGRKTIKHRDIKTTLEKLGLDLSLTEACGETFCRAIAGQATLFVAANGLIEQADDHLASLLELPKRLLKCGAPFQELVEFRVKRGDLGSKAFENLDKIIQSFFSASQMNFDPGTSGGKMNFDSSTPGGNVVCVKVSRLPSGGNILVYTDLTHVKNFASKIGNQQRELKKSEDEYQVLVEDLTAVIDNIEYGVVFMDQDLRATLINRAFREMWGMDKKLCDSRPHMRDLMNYNRHNNIYDVEEAEFDGFVESRMEAVRLGAVPPTEFRRRDGKTLIYRSYILADGRRMMTYFDVTEMKDRERESRRHAETLEVVQNATGHGVTWFDKNLRLRTWNKKCAEMLELEDADVAIGDSLEKVFRFNALRGVYGEGDPEQQVADRMKLAQIVVPHRFDRSRADGTVLQVEGFPVADDGFVTVYTDVTEARRSQEKIEYLAHHDALTGLANRVQFSDCLAKSHAKVFGERNCFAVISFDLDRFKDVNDTMGHDIGDQLLKAISARVQSVLHEDDIFARLGGDEFAVLRNGIDKPNEAGKLAQKIVDLTSNHFEIDGHEIVIGASAGVSFSTPERPGTNPDQILRESDLALYSVKSDRRGTYRYFKEEMNIQLCERKNLERDLSRAVQNEEFRVFYQPQVDAKTHNIVGAEALVRWEHPTRGLVGPIEFIEIAEETGLIRQIGQHVIETACADFAKWDHLKLAVNLSPVQFRLNDISKMVSDILTATEFDASRLELEITENVQLLENSETLEALRRLKSLGVSIALDDFGTGYSSLSYLRRFPFDKLKIDRNFISDMGHSGEPSHIVQAVISLGKGLGMRVNAEGIETHLQADMLCIEGCDELQGYFFGKPMPIDELEQLIEKKSGSNSASCAEEGDANSNLSPQKIVRIA